MPPKKKKVPTGVPGLEIEPVEGLPSNLSTSFDKAPIVNDDLNKIYVPLNALRTYIAEMQKEGYKKLPLGHFLGEIKRICDEDVD
jgi:hypothetical protein